jgi:hypothetical protein
MSNLGLSIENRIAEATANGDEPIRGQQNQLLLDLDTAEDIERLAARLDKLREFLAVEQVDSWTSQSGKGRHVVLAVTTAQHFNGRNLTVPEQLLLQMWLGSDPLRELLSLMRYWQGCEQPSLLVRPKAAAPAPSPTAEPDIIF